MYNRKSGEEKTGDWLKNSWIERLSELFDKALDLTKDPVRPYADYQWDTGREKDDTQERFTFSDLLNYHANQKPGKQKVYELSG